MYIDVSFYDHFKCICDFLKTGTNFQESFLHPRVIIVVIMIIAIIVIKFFLDAFKLSLIRGCSRITSAVRGGVGMANADHCWRRGEVR